jgi:phosphotransferase system HPr-like phosphotransfer protein
VEYESKMVSGKDGTGLLRLSVPQGEVLLFTVSGQREKEVCEELYAVLKELSEQNYQ